MNISRDRSSQGGNHRKSRDTSSGHLLGGGQKKKKNSASLARPERSLWKNGRSRNDSWNGEQHQIQSGA